MSQRLGAQNLNNPGWLSGIGLILLAAGAGRIGGLAVHERGPFQGEGCIDFSLRSMKGFDASLSQLDGHLESQAPAAADSGRLGLRLPSQGLLAILWDDRASLAEGAMSSKATDA